MDNRKISSAGFSLNEQSYSVDTNGLCSVEDWRDLVMERHMSGGMEPAEEAAFIEHLLDCTTCNRELQFREALRDELVKEPLDEVLAGNVRELSTVNKPQTYFKYYAAAAAIILCLASWFYLVDINGEQPWGELAVLQAKEEKPLILQGEGEERIVKYNAALQSLISAQPRFSFFSSARYDARELTNAIEGFEELFEQNFSADIRSDIGFYLFKSYLLKDDVEMGIHWLSKAAMTGGNSLKQQRYKGYVERMLLLIVRENISSPTLTASNRKRLKDRLEKLNADLSDPTIQSK